MQYKKIILKYSTGLMLGAMILATPACKKDFTDPSKASEDIALKTPTGLAAVNVGLQRVYSLSRASNVYNIIATTGLVTRELTLLNAGNLPEAQLASGGTAVDGTNTMLAGIWTTSNKIIYDADNVLTNSDALSDKGFASGLIGFASIYKALALGTMAMYWQNVPDNIGTNATFITRAQGFDKAIAVIDNALAKIQANAISSTFSTYVPAGVDIVNTLQALKARYSLFGGKFAQALTAANAVDLTKRSTFNYEAANPNPIFDVAGSNFNVFQPRDSTMGLPAAIAPDLSDKRVPFYMALSGSSASRFLMKGFFGSTTMGIPIYLPGEITLIKAECFARQNDLTNALVELNKIVTKKAANDAFGVGADLPAISGTPTQSDILDQIYRNRCIELYMSGLKLEDIRRFNRPSSERSRTFMPYPFRERDNNPNTPPDPAG